MNIGRWRIIIRMIDEIERLEAKFERVSFADARGLGHGEIPLRQSRRQEQVASRIAESIGEVRIRVAESRHVPELIRRAVGRYGADAGSIRNVRSADYQSISELAYVDRSAIGKGKNC